MDKETITVQQKPLKSKSRYNIYVFLVCLLFSTLIWLFIKLSQDYKVVVQVGIDYINVPKDKFITKADTSFSFTVKVNGFKLLTHSIPKHERIAINLTNVSFKESSKTHYSGYIELLKYVESIIFAKSSIVEEVVSITPEIVYLELDYAYSKKVPVKANYAFTLAKQYFVYSPIKILPDSIYIYGSKPQLEIINAIETDSLDLKNLKESFDDFVMLKHSNNFNYNLSQKSVKIIIPIEKFTEMELVVPISIPDNKGSRQIKIFPKNTRLTLMVALKDYPHITADMFKIAVDTLNVSKNMSLPLFVEVAPLYVKVNKILPNEVEFIKIK